MGRYLRVHGCYKYGGIMIRWLGQIVDPVLFEQAKSYYMQERDPVKRMGRYWEDTYNLYFPDFKKPDYLEVGDTSICLVYRKGYVLSKFIIAKRKFTNKQLKVKK